MKRKDEATCGPGQHTETALFAQAQAGCQDSLNRLMAIHENLVHAVVRRQALGCLPFSEALQAGRIGLWRAIQGYDPERGLAFSTYAWKPIMHRIWREVKLAERAYQHEGRHSSLRTAPAATLAENLPDKVSHMVSVRVPHVSAWSLQYRPGSGCRTVGTERQQSAAVAGHSSCWNHVRNLGKSPR